MKTGSEDFRAAVTEVGRALSGFVGGHSQPYRSRWAQDAEVTIFGYTMSLERGQALLSGATAAAPMVLRVTHVYRRVDGVWKLLHRHPDHLTAKTVPPAVLASAARSCARDRWCGRRLGQVQPARVRGWKSSGSTAISVDEERFEQHD